MKFASRDWPSDCSLLLFSCYLPFILSFRSSGNSMGDVNRIFTLPEPVILVTLASRIGGPSLSATFASIVSRCL